jgi:hypothetical protein
LLNDRLECPADPGHRRVISGGKGRLAAEVGDAAGGGHAGAGDDDGRMKRIAVPGPFHPFAIRFITA